uniref:Uncharacterized protein n=1 Tax=Molossus molossus TaxID=27622 RepID=A0A7J8GRK1_MOLMO|nr:hypothetical protein HJG59_011285 [Molossus molossus]
MASQHQGFKGRFFHLSALTFDWVTLCDGACLLHCRMLSSILGLLPLDANNTVLSWDNRKCFQTLPNIHWGEGPTSPDDQCSRGEMKDNLPILQFSLWPDLIRSHSPWTTVVTIFLRYRYNSASWYTLLGAER